MNYLQSCYQKFKYTNIIGLIQRFKLQLIEKGKQPFSFKLKIINQNSIISVGMPIRKRKQPIRSKYTKVPIKTKLKFLRKIIFEGFSIKDSATIFNINYSTAKTLIGQYKSQSLPWDLNVQGNETELDLESSTRKRRGYRVLEFGIESMVASTQEKCQCFQLSSQNNIEDMSQKISKLLEKRIQIISSINQQ